jgi:hypothetical protein
MQSSAHAFKSSHLEGIMSNIARVFRLAVAATAVLTSPLALAASTAPKPVDPDWDAGKNLTVEEALDLSMQPDVPVELIQLLSTLYSDSADLDIIAALRRLERESPDPAVREAAAAAQKTKVAVPDAPVTRNGVTTLPTDVDAVLVECQGECGDNTLGDFCEALTDTPVAVAVSCQNVQDGVGSTVQCGGGGDNRCDVIAFNNDTPLDQLCDDSSGWDAIVYCERN